MEKLVSDTNSSINYKKGDKIKVFYEPSNPSKSSLQSDNYHKLGWVGIALGTLALLGSWFWYKMTMKYRFIAAAEGFAGAGGMIADSIR